MLRFYAEDFYQTMMRLSRLEGAIKRHIQERGLQSFTDEKEARHIRHTLDYIGHSCKHAKLSRALERLEGLSNIHPDFLPGSAMQLVDVKHELEELRKAITNDLFDRLFVIIPSPQDAYYEQEELFGRDVATRFPEANKEITAAGNCYATGNDTACIFHLMRAAEHGLRKLAIKLNVSFPQKPQKDIEFRMWSEVIGEVIKAINAKPNAKNPSEAEELQILNQAADQIQFFKDAWRDVVMHSREPRPYNEHDAMSAITSVKAFMKLIALLP